MQTTPKNVPQLSRILLAFNAHFWRGVDYENPKIVYNTKYLSIRWFDTKVVYEDPKVF